MSGQQDQEFHAATERNSSAETKRVERAKLYPQIFAIKDISEYRSGCAYYEIRNVEIKKDLVVSVAFCRVLNRYLTVYEAANCVRYWDKCPYRAIYSIAKRSSL